MELNRHISRRLHEEHTATLGLWGSVERALVGSGSHRPPAEAETLRLLRRAAAALDEEVGRHFAFEEKELFPRLAAAGEGDIAALLAEEHVTIRAAAKEFAPLVAAGLDAHGWERARALALELTERLVAHVHKEEMSLLPALDDLLDEIADRELTEAYLTP